MNIEVTRDNVTILEQSETPHENEYKITTCYFTFDDFTSSFQVKRAIFTILSTEEMYETDIINNQCDIPSEVLKHEYETVKLGVYGYNIGDNEELLNRFSPSYAEIVVPTGSYKEGALSPEPITPSQYDLYSQALQEGLQEVDDKLDEVVETVDSKLEEVDDKLEVVDGKIQDMDDALDDVDTAITETNNLNLDVSDKVDGDVTVTLTKKDASTKSVVISDGTSLMFNWDGTKLGVKTDEDSEYVYVDLQGIQGVPGPQGEPFRIKKTYSSVAEMNADFNNMQYGDYVMIASTVEVEDNAKLYTRGESQWIFITDFSGATGIKGETGATPNIQIGTVTSGSTPSVTRTGTNENPVLNFVLQPGEKGNKGDTGATGNGIASITKTSTSGLVDTYTITYTSGNTTTFNVTNGNGIDHISLTSQSGATKVYTIYFTDGNTTTFTVEDGEVTQEVFDEEVDRLKMVYNAMPKVSGEGTDLTLNNTAECPVYDVKLSPSALEQETTTGKNLAPSIIFDKQWSLSGSGDTRTITTSTYKKCEVVKVSPNTTYTISGDFSSLDGNVIRIAMFDNEPAINSVSTKFVFSASPYTFTTQSTTNYILLYNSSNINTTVNNLQVELGDAATSYEPFTYGPSPNPQYPQQIHTVSGENTVVVGNKNLFDEDSVEFTTDILDDNGNPTGSTTSHYTNNYYNVSPNTDYVLSGTLQNTSGDAIRIYFYSKDKNWISRSNIFYTNSVSFTTPSNCYHIRIQVRNIVTLQTHDVMLRSSTTSTDYVEHQEQTYPLSLGNLEYCKIGDYEDLFFKNVVGSEYYDNTLELDKWYLKKNIGKLVLDGSESWHSTSAAEDNTKKAYYLNASNIDNYKQERLIKYSNYYRYEQVNWKNANSPCIAENTNVGNMLLFRNDDIISLTDWKNWLTIHNTIVYYVYETPESILLSDTLQTQLDNLAKAITYQDQTNVSQTNNDLPFVIKLSAIRDLSGIFELIQG